MKIDFIHTADVHIGLEFNNGKFGTRFGAIRRREILDTFFRICDRAIDNKSHLLLISGDLFDEDYIDINDIKILRSKFKQLINTRIIIVSGNHDPIYKKSLYNLIKWPDNVYIFKEHKLQKIELNDINTVIWGFSWQTKQEKEELNLKHIQLENEKTNILIIHGDIFDRNSKYLPINKNSLIDKGFDYVALGHIHKHQFINKRICYPGSPEPLDFGELRKHGIVEGTLYKDDIDIRFLPFAKREFIIKKIKVNPNMDYLEIINNIKECDLSSNKLSNFYRIILDGIRDYDIKLNISELEDLLSSEFDYIEIIDKTIPDYDLVKLQNENADNIIGMFIAEMKNKDLDNKIVKDALYYGLKALLKEKV